MGECKHWCTSSQSPWEEKCFWKSSECSGCEECASFDLPGTSSDNSELPGDSHDGSDGVLVLARRGGAANNSDFNDNDDLYKLAPNNGQFSAPELLLNRMDNVASEDPENAPVTIGNSASPMPDWVESEDLKQLAATVAELQASEGYQSSCWGSW